MSFRDTSGSTNTAKLRLLIANSNADDVFCIYVYNLCKIQCAYRSVRSEIVSRGFIEQCLGPRGDVRVVVRIKQIDQYKESAAAYPPTPALLSIVRPITLISLKRYELPSSSGHDW